MIFQILIIPWSLMLIIRFWFCTNFNLCFNLLLFKCYFINLSIFASYQFILVFICSTCIISKVSTSLYLISIFRSYFGFHILIVFGFWNYESISKLTKLIHKTIFHFQANPIFQITKHNTLYF